uniref:Uncharacterized protein n=1 Tax=Micrurus corallinus TaxID=54390 RepID=A0A2D4G000_MICCO
MAFEGAVQAAGREAPEDSHEHEEETSGGHQGPPAGGREHPQHGHKDDNQDHAEELDAGAQEGAEDHGILRRPEDVPVHQLPPRLLHGVLNVIFLVVVGNVFPERPDDDHTENA